MPRLLVLSNGHGEDTIACKVLDRLQASGAPPVEIEAWPIVGEGAAYRDRSVPCVGPPNLLPSAGFATLSARWMWRDLRAGWIGVHLDQLRAASKFRGRYALALAVGDVVPMALAALARVPFVFVGCAKSVHYGRRYGYTNTELRLLRRRAVAVFPRDHATTAWLCEHDVASRYVGNPMMDDLEPDADPIDVPVDATVIGALPGSRDDAPVNAVAIADVAASLASMVPSPPAVDVVCAAATGFDDSALLQWLSSRATGEWVRACPTTGDETQTRGQIVKLVHRTGLRFQVVRHRFADVILRSTVVVGLAGTANEQAVGLGRPVVTFPTQGPFDEAYLRMKMRFLRGAAVAVARDPQVVAATVRDLLADPERRARMAGIGRERMGLPGGSATIAADLAGRLGILPG